MAQIKFIRGTKAQYSQETYTDCIFFATDTKEIILNNVTYGLSDAVKNVELEASTNKIKVTKSDGTSTTFAIANATTSLAGLMSAEDKAKLDSLSTDVEGEYDSAITDTELQMPSAVGGIAKGTTVADLEGKSFSEMFDALLFPTVNPTYVEPSASLSLKSFAATQEVGSEGPDASANFTTGYNPGAINLNGVKQNNRGGLLKSAESFIYVNNDPSNKAMPATIALGNTTFKYRAAYEAGPQPKNNKGENYGTPLAAGTVDSSAVTVNGTHPWFATTATAGTLTKQALIAWNASAGSMVTPRFVMQPHSAAAKQIMKFPRKLNQLQMLNTVSNQMETISFSDWTETSASEETNGVATTFYTYTYNGSDRGSVTLIAKF